MDEQLRARINDKVSQHDVVLFMKGDRSAPRCGFSATVVGILDSLIGDYETVDVLADGSIRDGIKEFSDWPTIPQLYIKGEFVGGCDIIREMFDAGELEEALGLEVAEITPPSITVSESAAEAFKNALADPSEVVRLEVDARYNHGLTIGARGPRDVIVESAGITLALDRGSAGRAEGVLIDYVDSPNGPAFKINNPSEPPKVQSMTVAELKALLDAGPVRLYDARTTKERETAKIEGSTLLDKDAQKEILALPADEKLVFHCHHGGRSQQAAEYFLAQGRTNVFNVVGGIDAWSLEIDPKVPRY